jgi:hypothetical protein
LFVVAGTGRTWYDEGEGGQALSRKNACPREYMAPAAHRQDGRSNTAIKTQGRTPMKRLRFNHAVMMILTALSAVFFVLQYLIFRDIEEETFLLFQDLMFLPIEILLVTFILDRILRSREKQEKLQQIHIVISPLTAGRTWSPPPCRR